MIRSLSVAVLVFFLSFSIGAETRSFEKLRDPVHVVAPETIEEGKRYPALFYFHGTGGSAGVGPMEHYVEGIDCFLIGCGYRNQGQLTMENGMIEDEFANFREVRDALVAEFPIDPARIFVSGFSKGGWISAFLVEADASVAGAAPMGAGAVDGMPIFDPRAANGKPVYIGIGIEEANHVLSLRLRDRLKKLGAATTLDEWDETGHTLPKGPGGAVGLRQWMQVHLAPGSVTTEEARNWARERLAEIRGMEDEGRRFLALLRFREMPYLQLLGDAGRTIVEREIALVEKNEAAAPEAQAWRRYENLIAQELRDRSASALKRYLEDHRRNAADFPETVSAGYSSAAADRIARVLGQ